MSTLPHRIMTDRLLLRTWLAEDLTALGDVFAREEVWWSPFRRGWTRDETAVFLERQQQQWEQEGFGLWAACDRPTSQLIGFIGLNYPRFLPRLMPAVEIGWRLHPQWWGRGLATEGARVALHHGFEALKLDQIISIAEPNNSASLRIMAKLGMTLTAHAVHPQQGVPLHIYQLDRTEWEQATKPC